MIIFTLFFVVLLLIASASFSLSEIAFFSLPSSKVKSFRYSLEPKKRMIAKLLKQSKGLLVSIFLLNTIANILIQNLTSDLFDPISGSWILKVAVPLVLILVFGELLPKYLGLLYNESVALFMAPFYDWFQRVSQPIRHVITLTVNFLSRILFFYMKVEKPLTQEELEHILKTSEGKGLLHQEEASLVQGYLAFCETQVKDLMQPRAEMESYDINHPLSKLYFMCAEKNVSTIPVCKDSLDNFLGLVDASDLFIYKDRINSQEVLQKLLYKPFFVPETTTSKALLAQFQARDENVAIVVDEYGAISGIITKEMLVEAITKPELQKGEVHEDFVRVGPDAIIANGALQLQVLNDYFQVDLKTEYHSVTVAGWLLEKLGSIPKSGAVFREDPLFFRVLEADQTRIKKIYIQKSAKTGTSV